MHKDVLTGGEGGLAKVDKCGTGVVEHMEQIWIRGRGQVKMAIFSGRLLCMALTNDFVLLQAYTTSLLTGQCLTKHATECMMMIMHDDDC